MADCFALMRLPFESPGAIQLNKDVFETIYYGALWASTEVRAGVWGGVWGERG